MSTELYILKNVDIEVNGVSEGTVSAGSSVDIQLSDSLGVVTPISVTQTGNDFAVVLPTTVCPPAVTRSTATLMKTGQTTSYRTGDDGDIEAGRATDFFTLDAAPVHNDGSATLNTTTNRFTDTLGGSTYANNIALDWSTWNGSTLLGWYRVRTVDTWNNAIDNSLALSIASFTSGWRLNNLTELMSIVKFQLSPAAEGLLYSPFNLPNSTGYWTSNTRTQSPAAAYRIVTGADFGVQSQPKTNNNSYISVRTFSLSTSNVLS